MSRSDFISKANINEAFFFEYAQISVHKTLFSRPGSGNIFDLRSQSAETLHLRCRSMLQHPTIHESLAKTHGRVGVAWLSCWTVDPTTRVQITGPAPSFNLT